MHRRTTQTTAVPLVLSMFLPNPPEAQQPRMIAGVTKARFIDQAAALGYREDALKAWGDRDQMAAIPVEDEGSPGASFDTETTGRASYRSGSCTRTVKNVFGGLLMQLTVRKTWRVMSSKDVAPYSASYSTKSGFLWNFDGLAGSQEFYTKIGTSPKGMHTSKRHARFSHPIPPPEARTIWAEVNGTTISYGCRYGG